MLKRVTVFFALFCVMAVAGLAQQRVVISNGAISKEPLIGNVPEITSMATYNPYKDLPSKLATDTTLDLLFVTSSEDIPLSDTSRTVILNPTSSTPDTVPIVLTFAPTGVNSGSSKSYDIIGFFQPVEPFTGGTFRVDSIFIFIFRANGLEGTPLEDDIYVFPVGMPDGINLSTYNVSLNSLTFNDENPFYIISKDSLNSPDRYPAGSIQGLMVPTPGMFIDRNKKFGLAFISANWFDKQQMTDTWGMIATHDWDVPAAQTYGGLIRHNIGASEDTVQNIHAAQLSFGQGPRLKQNFIIRMFGQYNGEWPITDVRQDPNAGTSGLALEANYPNPASNETHIRFSIDRIAPVTLRLTNMLGQIVETTTFSDRTPGSYIWDVNTSHLPTGTYIYSLTIGDRTITRTMTIAR